jgi:hypothetical protein
MAGSVKAGAEALALPAPAVNLAVLAMVDFVAGHERSAASKSSAADGRLSAGGVPSRCIANKGPGMHIKVLRKA